MPENGLIMSDLPWAMAWYGHRQSIWLPLQYKSRFDDKLAQDFHALNSRKPVNALYFSIKSMKALEPLALWRWIQGETQGQDWEDFLLGVLLKREVPAGFPLKVAPEGLGPEIFLTDSERGGPKTIKSQ